MRIAARLGVQATVLEPVGGGAEGVELRVELWLLDEFEEAVRVVHAHDAEARRLVPLHGDDRDGDVGVRRAVGLEHVVEVHAIQPVAAQDQHVSAIVIDEVADVLAQRVGSAAIPVGPLVGLLRREDFDEAPAEGGEFVGVRDVVVEADAEELGEDVQANQAAVDAVADGDVDEAVLARDGDGGDAAVPGQRVQGRPASAAQEEANHVLHRSALVTSIRPVESGKRWYRTSRAARQGWGGGKVG